MAKEPMEFKDFSKACKFRTYQEAKCVNKENKSFRKVGSCTEVLCPIFKSAEFSKPAEEAGKPGK